MAFDAHNGWSNYRRAVGLAASLLLLLPRLKYWIVEKTTFPGVGNIFWGSSGIRL
jgi:hypothetical protein